MIKKISKLDKIGKFSSITQEKDFQFGEKGQNCNIIFGFNGSGKTIISNSLSFFADNSFISEEEKTEIFNDLRNSEDSVAELDLQGNSRIKYPANNAHSKSIFIFNSNFIATHVFNGTRGNLKKFSNIGGEIKNKEIDKINEQTDILNKEKSKLDDENKRFDEKHEEITKTKSTSFGKSLTDKYKKIQAQDLLRSALPTETIEILETKLGTLSVDYDLSKKQIELNSDLQEIRQINFGSVELDINVIGDFLSKNIQQLSKDVLEKKIQEVQNLFSDDQHKQGVERWFRFGKDILENSNTNGKKHCPICNTDISEKINAVLADYQGYFDETYEDFIKELKQKIDDISTIIVSVEQYEFNANKLEKINIKYEKLLSGFSFERYDFTNIKTDINNLKNSLKSKNDNIQNSFANPRYIEKNITAINSALINFQKFKDDTLGCLESKRLNTNAIEDEIRKTYKEIILLEFNQIEQSGALEKYKKNQDRITLIINTEIPALRNKLSNELKKIKAESKSISKYLIKMGINHFDIDINENKKDENIIIKYKNSSNEKNKLKNCLSEGEKTALAFAYFLSKFENEINTDEKIKESVVIIDDPISSLDDNRLYSTAHLIWRNFENVKQLIVMSHNFLFLKFFNSFYYSKANCLFLDQEKLSKLPEELKNFETPYFFMLQELINFQNGKNSYTQCCRYLPNYTRRVLETFLSFKFAKISSAKNKNYSPGIEDFDENINETNLEEKLKKDLIDKIKEVKNISDKFAHGNLQHTQENFYISETELKNLIQNAIYVIETMDNLHKTCFVKKE